MWCGPTPYRGYHEKLYMPRGGKQDHEWGWISFRPYSGGEMTGWGAHGLDQIQWALGMDESGPVEIWPVLDEEPPFDGVHLGPRWPVHMRYANGVVVKLDDQGAPGGGWFEGDEGEIKIDRDRYAIKPGSLDKELPELEPIPFTGGTDEHIGNWLHCVRTRQTPNADVEIGHRSTTVCHLGNIARWLKRSLTWDPVTETFPGDDEANRLVDRERRVPWTLG
jgi:predicted dehydrogenase